MSSEIGGKQTIPAIIAVFMVVIIATQYQSVSSPIVETFNTVITDKTTKTAIIMVGQVTVPTKIYYVEIENGVSIKVSAKRYAVLQIGDTVLVGIKQNGEYDLV